MCLQLRKQCADRAEGDLPIRRHPIPASIAANEGVPSMTVASAGYRGANYAVGVRRLLSVSALLVTAFAVSLIVRRTGSDFTPVDGWGVDLFELSMGALCIGRYWDRSWRATEPVAKAFPLVLGLSCISWALGDTALTVESLGGVTAPVPSVADLIYIGFFPLCFI